MGLRIHFPALLLWCAFLSVLSFIFVILIPLSGWGWTSSLEAAGCRPLGWCREEVERPHGESRVERVSMQRLLLCQRDGLDSCQDLRTWDDVTVKVLVDDAVYVGRGVLLSDGARGRELHYLKIAGQRGSERGSLYCAYSGGVGGGLPPAVRELAVGSPVLFTAELRWEPDSDRFRTYDEFGDPSCQLGLLDGRPWRR